MVDGPGGGGKIPLSPNYVVSTKEGVVTLRNFEGKVYTYYEPGTASAEMIAAGLSANGNGNGYHAIPDLIP